MVFLKVEIENVRVYSILSLLCVVVVFFVVESWEGGCSFGVFVLFVVRGVLCFRVYGVF